MKTLKEALEFEDGVTRSFVTPTEEEYHTAIVEAARKHYKKNNPEKPLHPDLQLVVDKLEKLIGDIKENPHGIGSAEFNQHHMPTGIDEVITIHIYKLPTR